MDGLDEESKKTLDTLPTSALAPVFVVAGPAPSVPGLAAWSFYILASGLFEGIGSWRALNFSSFSSLLISTLSSVVGEKFRHSYNSKSNSPLSLHLPLSDIHSKRKQMLFTFNLSELHLL